MDLSADFNWINRHLSEQPTRLRLKYGAAHAFDILQIECRAKYAAKFAQTLAADPQFVFPDALAAEQATSDRMARFHASLIGPVPKLLDMTAGLGIDARHFAAAGASVTAIERRPEAAAALRLNTRGLGVEVVEGDSCQYLAQCSDNEFDTIFVDPARRKADGSRAFALTDCEPDVTALLPQMQRTARTCVVKMSPMLDVTHTAAALGPHCCRIIATGTATECRELLAVLDFSQTATAPTISAVTMLPDGSTQCFDFTAAREHEATVATAMPKVGNVLHELYPAAIKAGALKLPAARCGLAKLHPNTHLYIGSEAAPDFPGTRWHILDVLPYSSSNIKRFKRTYPKISVAVRNFGATADKLRAKLGAADGGPLRAIGVTAADSKPYILVISPYQDDVQ